MTAIVIDGISAVGKSTLLAALQRRLLETRPNYSRLVLSEHFTERWLEGRDTDPDAVEAHVGNVLRLAADLRQLHKSGPFAGNAEVLTVLVERLFLTLLTRGLLPADFVARQAGLIQLAGLRSVLLMLPPEQIEARLATSLEHRSARWGEYIASLGGLRPAVAHFSAQQGRMLAANENLRRHMPAQVIEVVGMEVLTAPTTLDALLIPDGSSGTTGSCPAPARTP